MVYIFKLLFTTKYRSSAYLQITSISFSAAANLKIGISRVTSLAKKGQIWHCAGRWFWVLPRWIKGRGACAG